VTARACVKPVVDVKNFGLLVTLFQRKKNY
jgi:hypothetical protein